LAKASDVELRVFPTHREAVAAFDKERGVGHYFRQLEVLHIDNLRGKARELLQSRGVPGVRYLDWFSRKSGEGTSNYVVFRGNEDLIKILRRNDVPLDPQGK
jgi:hypothetical protein